MEDKEVYVYLDLNGKLDHNFFQKENLYFKMVNIDTDSPLVQVGNFVFQGIYCYTLIDYTRHYTIIPFFFISQVIMKTF